MLCWHRKSCHNHKMKLLVDTVANSNVTSKIFLTTGTSCIFRQPIGWRWIIIPVFICPNATLWWPARQTFNFTWNKLFPTCNENVMVTPQLWTDSVSQLRKSTFQFESAPPCRMLKYTFPRARPWDTFFCNKSIYLAKLSSKSILLYFSIDGWSWPMILPTLKPSIFD